MAQLSFSLWAVIRHCFCVAILDCQSAVIKQLSVRYISSKYQTVGCCSHNMVVVKQSSNLYFVIYCAAYQTESLLSLVKAFSVLYFSLFTLRICHHLMCLRVIALLKLISMRRWWGWMFFNIKEPMISIVLASQISLE